MTNADSMDRAQSGPEPAALGLDLWGNRLPVEEHAPSNPLGHSPLRRPGSIRRTMSIDVDWPDENPLAARFQGRARDIYTPEEGGDAVLLSEDAIEGRFADRRTIGAIASLPPRADVARLAGERAGSNLRAAIDRALHKEKKEGAPLYLLLDDLAGASLVCMWGWARWHPNYMQQQIQAQGGEAFNVASMEGVCIGFRPGSHALDHRPGDMTPNSSHVLPLPNPADPQGWHDFAVTGQIANFRRARLIDIWREDGLIRVESVFQDSSSLPGTTTREAIHEYRLSATADMATGELLTLNATAGSLPHAECPAAMVNMKVVLGTPMAELRETVLDRLKRTAGCTHLNDMIRSIAEAPVLAGKLPSS